MLKVYARRVEKYGTQEKSILKSLSRMQVVLTRLCVACLRAAARTQMSLTVCGQKGCESNPQNSLLKK